jgi:hypothetical protein
MEQLDRLEAKIDKILDMQNEHAILLAKHGMLHEKNADELHVHIKRTAALEKEIHQLWKYKFMVAGIITAVSIMAPLILKSLGIK